MENFLLTKWNVTESEFAKILRRARKMNFLSDLDRLQINTIKNIINSSRGTPDIGLARYLDERLTPYYNNAKELKTFPEIAADKGVMVTDLQEFSSTLSKQELYKWKRVNPFLETEFGVPREAESEFLAGFLEWYLLSHKPKESKEFKISGQKIRGRRNKSFKLITKNGRGGVVDLHPFDMVNLPGKHHGIIVGFYTNYEVAPYQSKCIVAFNTKEKLILLDKIDDKTLYRKWNWQKTNPVEIKAGERRVFFDIPITSVPGSDHERKVYSASKYQLASSNDESERLKNILQFVLYDLSRKFESYPIKVHGFSKVATSEAPNAPKFVMKISLPVTNIRSVEEVSEDFRKNVKKQNILWEKMSDASIIEILQMLVYPKGSAVQDIRATNKLLCSLESTKVAKLVYVEEPTNTEVSSLVHNQAFPATLSQMMDSFTDGCDTVVEAAELAMAADPKVIKKKIGVAQKTVESAGNTAQKVVTTVKKKKKKPSKVKRDLKSVTEAITGMHNNLKIGTKLDHTSLFDEFALLKTLNDDSTLKADICEGNTLHPALSEDVYAHIGKVLVQQVLLGSMVNNNRPDQGQEIIKKIIETPE